jgi:hypothetical protein
MLEKMKDFAYGAGFIVVVIGSILGVYELGEMVGLSRDNVFAMIAVPFFIYFSYVFGGLTRSIFGSKKS